MTKPIGPSDGSQEFPQVGRKRLSPEDERAQQVAKEAIPKKRVEVEKKGSLYQKIRGVSSLSKTDFEILEQYILENRMRHCEKARAGNHPVYVRFRADNGQKLPRPIQFDPDGTVFIHLNKGTVDRILGEGAFKRVRIAFDFDTEKIFAIASTSLGSQEIALLTQREIELQQACADVKGVAKLLRVVGVIGKEEKRKIFFFQPLYNQGDLASFLKKHELNLETKHKIALQLLEAVSGVRKKGILHRDIKLENILVEANDGSEPSLALADFGLACKEEDQEELATRSGALAYWSPDYAVAVYQDQSLMPQATLAMDAWALGCVLYELYCGKLPWVAEPKTLMNLFQLAKEEVPALEFPPHIPSQVKEVIRNLLQCNKEKRWNAEHALNHLRQFALARGLL